MDFFVKEEGMTNNYKEKRELENRKEVKKKRMRSNRA